MSYDNLETVIEDAVNDAQLPEESNDTSYDSSSDSSPADDTSDVSADSTDSSDSDSSSQQISSPTASSQVSSPAAAKNEPTDEFERLSGIQQMGVGNRENRIPYSRVKKITERAASEVAEAALGRKLNPGEKAVDVVKAHVAQLPALQSRVSDYESRLNTVGEFESVMADQPQRFLQMLATLPAYKEFFDFVERAVKMVEDDGQPAQESQEAPTSQAAPQQFTATDDMPEPDEELTDGSRVYSMQGLKNLLAWNSNQVKTQVTKQFEERYKPMESDYQARRRIEATLPLIRAQIAEAQSWPLFKESEEEITQLLSNDKQISLEAAYRRVVFPKLQAERNKMRQGILQEIKKAPVSPSSVVSKVASRPAAPNATSGPRALEDIIKEQVEAIRR